MHNIMDRKILKKETHDISLSIRQIHDVSLYIRPACIYVYNINMISYNMLNDFLIFYINIAFVVDVDQVYVISMHD